MKKKLALSAFAALCCVLSYAQNVQINDQTNSQGETKVKSLEERMEGTYMIINTSSKVTELLTTEVLLEIEKKRDDTKEIYYDYSKYIRIKILPRNIINASDFDPKKFN